MNLEPDHIIPRLIVAPRYRWLRHLAVQFVLLAVSVNVFWDTPDEFIVTASRFASFFSMYAVLNVMVYVNMFALTPRLLMRDRFLAYFLSVVGLIAACLLTIVVAESLIQTAEPEYEPSKQPGILNLLSSLLSIGLLIMGTSAIVLLKGWITDTVRVDELESETLQSELAMLRSQINPHFLFNMLNNSWLLIEKRRPETREVLCRLRELIRYQMEEGGSERVELRKEIAFLTDFLELEKVRRDRFEYRVACVGDPQGVILPPMLFIPFVENAVKHNNDSEKLSYTDVSFFLTCDSLLFRCTNSKPSVPAVPGDVGGIGLGNIRRRLELLYPGKHELEITNEKDIYTVTLRINL